jgi:ribonuclease BN (tRNA processing enzyme)
MDVIVLGSGTVTPLKARNSSGLALATRDRLLLVDMGPGTIRRLCEADLDARAVDAILITHFHPDHTADLIAFLFASNYAYGGLRESEFFIVGPAGIKDLFNRMVALYGHYIVPTGDRLTFVELSPDAPDSWVFGEISIRSTPAVHMYPCVSYRIEAEGVSVVCSGDTDVGEGLALLARNADLLVCESSFPDGMKVEGHLTASEAGETARRAGVKRLLLTHMYPPCDEQDIVAQARRTFDGEVIKAEDLMKLTIRRSDEMVAGPGTMMSS